MSYKFNCSILGKREKRSCLQYKDPPVRPLTLPPGVSGGSLVDSVPTFDPDNDLAYGIKTIGSPCKFWDTKREKWSSEGCKVFALSFLTYMPSTVVDAIIIKIATH